VSALSYMGRNFHGTDMALAPPTNACVTGMTLARPRPRFRDKGVTSATFGRLPTP